MMSTGDELFTGTNKLKFLKLNKSMIGIMMNESFLSGLRVARRKRES